MNPVADVLFKYLGDILYSPDSAVLDVKALPEEFQELGSGIQYFAECVIEAKTLAQALAKGDLTGKVPSPGNEIASPLKSLHASLKHLTWQTQQVAKGDYHQRVKFMGDFAEAFNSMATQLDERSKLERKEKTKLQQYINQILSSTPNIVLVFDTDGNAVLASKSYIDLCKNYSEAEIQGKSFLELFASTSDDEFLRDMDDLLKDALINKNTTKLEHTFDIAADGNMRSYDIYVTPVLYENETVIGTMTGFSDITEIAQAKREAERARELAEQSTRAKSDFLARMTHEMRTPMNAIIGMTSIGKAAESIKKKDYSFQKIEDASSHLLGVINDVLDMSKIEADKLELDYAEFDFSIMLCNVINIINLRVADKNQEFLVDIDDNIPTIVISDEQRLAQVITNLLSNAVKFTPEYGTITLTASMVDVTDGSCMVCFTIKDDGIGISKEQQLNLFTPFEQADGSISRKFGGTGLGLSISKRIVEMMGGSIWIESEIGMGATFGFDVKMQMGDETSFDDDLVEVHSDVAGIFKGKRVLIAEDVEINREIIAALLEDTGLLIDFACDGAEAVSMVTGASSGYELVLMDIQMPEMDGYEATRRIRESGAPELSLIPIIAMTANVFREDIERCIAAGMNDHLGKPVDLVEVIAKLKEYLL